MVNWLVRTVKHQPITGESGMVGMIGKARTALVPQGMIFVNGERWRAETTEGTHVEEGQPVRVVSVLDLLLMVEPVNGVIEADKKKKI
jgi:membrane-bound serine protease (ClpP class)